MAIVLRDIKELEQTASTIVAQGKRLVTTNGVFDLLHIGHVRYLQWCKEQGDLLLVGVNSDSSVKVNKGDKRPIVSEQDRAAVIASLACVDFVYLFNEKTPEAWLDVVKPKVHVKAGDYTLDRSKQTPKTTIWERDLVEKNGGEVRLAPLVAGRSSTSIIEKIREVYGSPEGSNSQPPNPQTIHHKPSTTTPKSSAVFVDRDGTIIQDKEYMHRLEDFEFIPGAVEGLKSLQDAGKKIIVLTNQSGLARGKFSVPQYDAFHQLFLKRLADHGVHPTGVYFCPHHPAGSVAEFRKNCTCRKPKPGMILQAVQDHAIDLASSVVVGDKTMDVMLGNILGIPGVLVKTGKAGEDGEFPAQPEVIAKDLKGAADWILSRPF